MTFSRAILAALIVIIGIMTENVWTATTRLSGEVAHLSERLDSLPAPLVLQSAMMRIDRPRVPPVRHFYKRPATVIDRICRP